MPRSSGPEIGVTVEIKGNQVPRNASEALENDGSTVGVEVFTIGHSTLEGARFIALVTEHEIACVCDVRRFPHSRRFDQFNRDRLAAALADAGICYLHLAELGGRRRATGTSDNAGWTNRSFRAYADHMATDEFVRGFERLSALSEDKRCCVMCAEATWWHCHRRLVADALDVRGFTVMHIASDGRAQQHVRTPFLVVDGNRLRYPPTQARLDV